MHYADLVATTILMADEHPLIALHPRTLLVHAGANASGTPTASLHRRACVLKSEKSPIDWRFRFATDSSAFRYGPEYDHHDTQRSQG